MDDLQVSDFKPDWSIHPGEVLEEYVEALGLSQAEFARRADLTAKLVNTIIKGKNPVEASTAVNLERVTGMKAYIWTRLQDDWDLSVSRASERAKHDETSVKTWLAKFPLKELVKRGVLPQTRDVFAQRNALLSFFGVANEKAYSNWDERLSVCYRASPTFRSSKECVRVWLQLAKHAADRMEIAPFNEDRLLDAVKEMRALTNENAEVFQPRLTKICAAAGVAVVPVPPLKGTKLNGAAFWFAKDKAAVALSLRHKTNDHFWFTLFHELGHICLHGRDVAYVDDVNSTDDGAETEADEWAEEHLVGRERLKAFIASDPRSKAEVRKFAQSVGVHAGIIVGMLQHHRALPWSHMNDLKARFEFVDRSSI